MRVRRETVREVTINHEVRASSLTRVVRGVAGICRIAHGTWQTVIMLRVVTLSQIFLHSLHLEIRNGYFSIGERLVELISSGSFLSEPILDIIVLAV